MVSSFHNSLYFVPSKITISDILPERAKLLTFPWATRLQFLWIQFRTKTKASITIVYNWNFIYHFYYNVTHLICIIDTTIYIIFRNPHERVHRKKKRKKSHLHVNFFSFSLNLTQNTTYMNLCHCQKYLQATEHWRSWMNNIIKWGRKKKEYIDIIVSSAETP